VISHAGYRQASRAFSIALDTVSAVDVCLFALTGTFRNTKLFQSFTKELDTSVRGCYGCSSCYPSLKVSSISSAVLRALVKS